MKITLSVIFFFAGFFSCFQVDAQVWSWARGNTGGGMDGWPIATDNSGNIFCGGVAWGPGSTNFGSVSVAFSSAAGTSGLQSILIKYDGNGNPLWANGTKSGNTWLIGVAADANGNSFMYGSINSPFVVIGATTLTNTVYPAPQYFLAKFDPSGNLVWAKNAGSAQGAGIAVAGICPILGTGAITTDPGGNIYIAGSYKLPTISIGTYTLTNTDPSSGTNDMFIAKYDPGGSVLWAKNAGGTLDDEVYGMTVTPAGDIYIAGQFASPSIIFGSSTITNGSGTEQSFIARFDASANPLWACASGGSGGEYAAGLASDLSNNVFLTGGLRDNSISFSGTTITNPTPKRSVLYLVKFDPSNNVDWYKTIYSPSGTPVDSGASSVGAWGYSIAMSRCGIVWVSGAMTDSVIADKHILSEHYIDSLHYDPIFVAGYTISSGTYVGGAALLSGGDDQNGIACDPSGNVFMCSDYWANLPFFVGPDTLPKGDGQEYLYIAKYPYPNPSLPNKTATHRTTCLGSGVALNAPPGYTHYLWNDGHTTPSFNVTETGTFWVYSFDSCVSGSSDTFIVGDLCECGKTLFLPNSFTPNGDGQNDVFYPRAGNDVTKILSFRVYNRWGELLFERENLIPNDISNAWDGTYQGDKPHPDVYVWTAEALCVNGNTVSKKGSVTIIR